MQRVERDRSCVLLLVHAFLALTQLQSFGRLAERLRYQWWHLHFTCPPWVRNFRSASCHSSDEFRTSLDSVRCGDTSLAAGLVRHASFSPDLCESSRFQVIHALTANRFSSFDFFVVDVSSLSVFPSFADPWPGLIKFPVWVRAKVTATCRLYIFGVHFTWKSCLSISGRTFRPYSSSLLVSLVKQNESKCDDSKSEPFLLWQKKRVKVPFLSVGVFVTTIRQQCNTQNVYKCESLSFR